MCVWQETVRGCVLPRSVDVRPRGGALFTESSFIPHLGWPWLQAKEPVGPTASGGAHGCRGAPAVVVGLEVASGARGGRCGLRPRADPPLQPASLARSARKARSRDLSTVLSEVPFLTAPSPGAAAVLTLVTSAFSRTLPRDWQRLPRALAAAHLPAPAAPPRESAFLYICTY